MDPMLGMIFTIPWSWAPQGYQFCWGQIQQIQQSAALYSLMGAVFGGNGTSTFAFPNLAGRVPIHYGIAASQTTYPLGQHAGNETTTLTAANTPAHTHTANFTLATGPQNATIPQTNGTLSGSATLTAVQAVGDLIPNTGDQLGMGGSGFPAATIYVAPATTASSAALGGLKASVQSAALPRPAINASVATVTGGNVTLANSSTNTPVPTAVMQPFLALNFIIAVNGLYPSRP